MARAAPTLRLPRPSHRAWSEIGRRISALARAEQTRLVRELEGWPWRFRRAGGDPFERSEPAWRVGADQPALSTVCRVYVGTAEELDAAVRQPAFSTLFARTIRVVEIVGRAVPAAGTLRAFHRARAIVHRDGDLLWGPWSGLEGQVAGPLPSGATRLALHGPVGAADGWQLARRPIRALWLGGDTDETVLAAMLGGYLQAGLRRLWIGSIAVETVLASGQWPSLERVGGPVRDSQALLHVLRNAPRLRTLDLDVFEAPPLAPLVDGGIRGIRLSVPEHARSLLAAPRPAGLRWFGLAGFIEDDVATALARWAPRWFAREPVRPTGLAWLGL